jgi:hypothetical protein
LTRTDGHAGKGGGSENAHLENPKVGGREAEVGAEVEAEAENEEAVEVEARVRIKHLLALKGKTVTTRQNAVIASAKGSKRSY